MVSMDGYRYIFVIHLVGQKTSIFNLVLFFRNPSIDIDHITDRLGLMSSMTTSYLGSRPPPPINLSVPSLPLHCRCLHIVGKNHIFPVVKSIFLYLYSYLFGCSPFCLLSITNSLSSLTHLLHPQ